MYIEAEPVQAELTFSPIECDYLDGENADWAKRYLTHCRSKLAELAGEDARYAAYLTHEIAAYEDLLRRFQKPV